MQITKKLPKKEKILRIFQNLFRNALDKVEAHDKKKLYEDGKFSL